MVVAYAGNHTLFVNIESFERLSCFGPYLDFVVLGESCTASMFLLGGVGLGIRLMGRTTVRASPPVRGIDAEWGLDPTFCEMNKYVD